MSAEAPLDTRDILIVHSAMCNAFDECAALIRANPTPSPTRVKFLADHTDFILKLLHGHHEGEDLLLYPLLEERVPEQAEHTEDVDREHLRVANAIDAASFECVEWRTRPSAERAETLAAALVNVKDTLRSHLDDEERDIVPLAAVTLTQKEWDALAKHGKQEISLAKQPITFGMLTEALDKPDLVFMKRHLPLPVRAFYGVAIQRPWSRYSNTLRNGT